MTQEKKEFDLSEEDSNSFSVIKYKNITNFPKESEIINYIFEPQILLQPIIEDLETISQELKSVQKSQAHLRQDISKILHDELLGVQRN
jgi:hypothetical protein